MLEKCQSDSSSWISCLGTISFYLLFRSLIRLFYFAKWRSLHFPSCPPSLRFESLSLGLRNKDYNHWTWNNQNNYCHFRRRHFNVINLMAVLTFYPVPSGGELEGELLHSSARSSLVEGDEWRDRPSGMLFCLWQTQNIILHIQGIIL